MRDQPLESGLLAIKRMQGRHGSVHAVEIPDQSLHPRMSGIFDQMPIERMVVLPFVFLSKFIPHEQELLAGVPEHKAVIGTQVGEALPLISRHAAEDRTLTVHDLIMGKREDEIFEECVVQTEQDLAVMVAAVNRVFADVVEGVVHPPHVPLVSEAQPSPVDWPRNHPPSRRFLCSRCRLWKAGEYLRIEPAKKADG